MDDCWSELPNDLLEDIARRLSSVYVDYVRIRAVCKSWRSCLPPKLDYLVNQFPWLMISPESELDIPYGEHHYFYNLFENKVYHLNMPNDRPWKRCCGSSHGWLVLLEEVNPTILLFNPITRVEILLPPITTFPNVLDFNIHKVGKEYLVRNPFDPKPTRHSLAEIRDAFIKKVVLSTSPTSLDQDFIAVAIVNITAELAFCKKGDEGWTIIKDSKFFVYDDVIFYEDVIYYEGVFYVVDNYGFLQVCDVSHPSPLMEEIELPLQEYRPHVRHHKKLYLVDSFGELLMVYRLFDLIRVIDNRFMVYNTTGFDVAKLDSKRKKWVKVKSLGDHMLFLGTSSSLCLFATEFSGLKGNCIYFTGESNQVESDGIYCNHDSGVYNLGDGSLEELPNFSVDETSFLPPPVWLTPNPC